MSQVERNDDVPAPAGTVSEETNGETAAGTPTAEIEELRRKLVEREEEVRAHQDRFLRERAELDNFKKRTQRERVEELRFASEPLIRELLPIVDNLERAIEHGAGNGQSVLDGVRLILKSLLDVLERHGVKRVEALGQPFDPTHHQALSQVGSSEHEHNQVIEQHHTGYLLHDRLLRPALVTVASRKSQPVVESEPNSD